MKTQLQLAVIEQLGFSDLDDADLRSTLNDIHSYGINGGFGGFIYYSDTVAFAEQNKDDILDIARDMAESLEVDGAYSLIASFLEAHEYTTDDGDGYTADSVADAIYDPDHAGRTQVMNMLAWFAAEEFAHYMIEIRRIEQ